MTAQSQLTPNPEIIYTELENGEAVLLNMDTTNYFSLNQTGTRIWSLMGDGHRLGEIAVQLAEKYDITPERAEQSVLNLAGELVEAGLASPENG